MKKRTLVFILLTVVLIIIVALSAGILHNRNKNKGDSAKGNKLPEAYSAIDLSELAGYGADAPMPIRLPGSETVVWIEGISEEEAENLETIFRMMEVYAEEDGNEDAVSASLNRVRNMFDPEFNLMAAFQETEYDPSSKVAWVAQPIKNAIADDKQAEKIYFRANDDGSYTMSFAYYLLGYCYCNTENTTS